MPRRGRGAVSNASGRYEAAQRSGFDDGWSPAAGPDTLPTQIHEDRARTIITRNESPDISFDRSINPYRGCEHGCIYCYARPTHCYLGHSAGLDFETRIYAKPDAARLLEKELCNPRYTVAAIALGTNTDPYQPIERTMEITRSILEVLERANHPVMIVTKSALVLRDVDILSRMAKRGLAKVALSITTLDRHLARRMEPRASTPARRLQALERLHAAGVPVGVMVAPIIPGLNDHEIEPILGAAARAGVSQAGYVMLRLPLEIKELFREWLSAEYPARGGRVLSLLKSMHGGQDYDATFGLRQKGSGPYAALVANRFRLACRQNGLNEQPITLRNDLFRRPAGNDAQMQLL